MKRTRFSLKKSSHSQRVLENITVPDICENIASTPISSTNGKRSSLKSRGTIYRQNSVRKEGEN